MAKLLSFICLLALGVIACNAAPATRQDTGRYNPYRNNPYYNRNYYRNRDYYNNRRYYDNFFKQYNPNVVAQEARIVESNLVPNNDGVYSYNYETENGIHGEERGVAVPVSRDEQAEQVEGSYSYISPEGLRVGVRYTANENGFHPIITYDGVNAEQYANLQQPADIVLTRIH